MEAYLNFMLLRFGLIVGGLVVLALLVFAVAVVLRRKGKLEDARRYTDPVVRAGLRAAARRFEDGGRSRDSRTRRWDGRR